MLRRDFLAGSGSLVLAGLSQPRFAFGQTQYLPTKIIDVHCHVFNADDLPIVEFTEKSIARTVINKKQVKPYAPVIDSLVRDIAKRLERGAKNEEHYLDEIKANRREARNKDVIKQEEREFVIDLFRKWREKPGERLRPGSTLTSEILNKSLPGVILVLVRREMFPEISVPVDFSLGAVLDNSDGAFDFDTDVNSRPEILGPLVYDTPKGPISHTIKWVVSFTRYRRELLANLAEVNHGGAVLVTPALIDFTKWLDAPEPPMTVPKQVALMSRLSRERPANVPHIHGFVPFDPLRQAVFDKIGGAAADSPFAIVEKAIMQQGFVGVKLYPPMGFRASNNVGAGNDFPCWVRFGTGSKQYDEACRERGRGHDGLGNEPGATLDAVLMRLFEWCAANNVPIMAHTTNSHDAGPGYETRANPKYWQPVLKKFPNLRINFAHFGGFYDAYSKGRLNLGDLNKTWEWTIGRMAAAAPDQPIFADMSYPSEVLDPHSQQYRNALACMDRFRRAFANSERLLMYGTDWSMIGHEDKFFTIRASLPELVAKFLFDAGYSPKDRKSIFFGNAVRFLGLRKADGENSTRGRLEKFYQTPADRAWLSVFDEVAEVAVSGH
jgi:predicted TIM-barrel fold metal-dependent hydrolase